MNNKTDVNPKVPIGKRDCIIGRDVAGYKYIEWREDGAIITIYDYELKEMFNKVKEYKSSYVNIIPLTEKESNNND